MDAEFIRDARERLAITQAELGRRIGRTRRTIIRYEKGDEVPIAVKLAIERLLSQSRRAATKKKRAEHV
jgi:DNA-binding XRE family transcriptional regulator